MSSAYVILTLLILVSPVILVFDGPIAHGLVMLLVA